MKKIPVQEAIGKSLFHDLTAILESGFKGIRFKRGHIVTEADIPVLLSMGKDFLYIPEEGDVGVHEDDAAQALTDVIADDSVNIAGPTEGKFNFQSKERGLFSLDSDALRRINEVGDYTVTTIWNMTPVERNELVASLRIVPLLTQQEQVDRAVEIARNARPVLQVLPYRPLRTAFLITGNEVFYGRIPDAFEAVLKPKIAAFGANYLGSTFCPDDTTVMANAVTDWVEQGAELILLTGGMSVDPDDVTPTVIRQMATTFIFQGVPMQPGNMLTIAKRDQCTLVGVPGASMHSPVTSLDLFLPRIYAGVSISREDAIDLGAGGLSMAKTFRPAGHE